MLKLFYNEEAGCYGVWDCDAQEWRIAALGIGALLLIRRGDEYVTVRMDADVHHGIVGNPVDGNVGEVFDWYLVDEREPDAHIETLDGLDVYLVSNE